MIKRVNFTGRRRIPQACVELEVFDGAPRHFTALIDLSQTKLPVAAKIFLEAMSAGSSVVKRFDFGSVGAIAPPSDCTIGEIEGDNVFFAIKVVDETEQIGRILGIAENIRPARSGKQTAAGRQGILPIDERPLGQELWTLDFGEHDVTLIINSEVPHLKDRMRWDATIFPLIYPQLVRMILIEAIEQGDASDEGDDRWPTLWLRFGTSLHPEGQKAPAKADGDEDWREWIDEVVDAFAEANALRDQFTTAGLGDGNGEMI